MTFEPSTPEQYAFQEMMQSCPAKTVLSTGAGFAIGGVLGMFMSSVDWQSTSEEFQKLSTREQLKLTAKDMGARTWSSAKNFALVAAIFSSSEVIMNF
jgi:hypothetical protein